VQSSCPGLEEPFLSESDDIFSGSDNVDLSDKVALVTGGTHGIGAAVAVELARRGAHVAINGRHDDASGRDVKGRIEALGRRCELIVGDMAVPEDATRCVNQTTARLGAPAVLVHSAGAVVEGGLLTVAPETWYRAFDVHVHALYYLCRAAVPAMKERREGAIVAISSVAGIRGVSFNLCYQVVKGALPQFARALARELADDNIRVHCVAPGIIRTRFHDKMTPEQKKNNLDNRVPLHREGTPEQVATLIAELAANDYITGETITIDGGLTMRIA
jgi:NAD(P)-dependent dehydrogenase (short-subunit alcohol dehydrogenase family)